MSTTCDPSMRVTVTTPPTIEPLAIKQLRKQLELSDNDDSHDAHLYELCRAAREQWEGDTDSAVLTQTITLYMRGFDSCIELPKRPIQSITSIKYYDSTNTQQTVSSSVYSLDSANRKIHQAYLQWWPGTIGERWDGVQIIYVAGYASQALVPAIAKQAMLLLVGHYFENRDMLGNALGELKAYEALVRRYARSSYP